MRKEQYTRLLTVLRDELQHSDTYRLTPNSLEAAARAANVYDELREDLTSFSESLPAPDIEWRAPSLLREEGSALFLQVPVTLPVPCTALGGPLQLATMTLCYDDETGLFSAYFTTASGNGPAFFADFTDETVHLSACDQFELGQLSSLHESVGAGTINASFQTFLDTAAFFTEIRVRSYEVAISGNNISLRYEAVPLQLRQLEVLPGILTLEDLSFTNTIRIAAADDDNGRDLSYRFAVSTRVALCGSHYTFSCSQLSDTTYRFSAQRDGGVTLPTIPALLEHFGLSVPALDLLPEITLEDFSVVADSGKKKIEEVAVTAGVLFRPLQARFRGQLSFPAARFQLSLAEPLRVAEAVRRISQQIGLELPLLSAEWENLSVGRFEVALAPSSQSFYLELNDLFSKEICGSTLRFERLFFAIDHQAEQKPQVALGGALSFLDLRFECSGTFDEHYSFEAVLQSDGTLRDYQDRFENHFGVKLPFSLPGLGLEVLRFTCSTNRSFQLSVELQSFTLSDLGLEVELLRELAVTAPSLEIAYDQESKFFCEIHGGFELKGLSFDLRFTRRYDTAAGKAGYFFYGELNNDYALGELAYFSEHFRELIPEAVRDLTLKKLTVTYDSLEDHFLFTAEIRDLLHYDFELGLLRRIDVDDCRLQFHIRNKKVHFNLQGDLAINDAHLTFETDYATGQGLSLAAYNKDAVNLNLKGITDHYLGDNGLWTLVPAYFRTLTFDRTRLQFRSSPVQVSLDISTRQLGGLYGFLGKSKQGLAALLCLVPPAKIPFAEISSDLAFLESLDFTGSFLVLSTADAAAYEEGQLPDSLKGVSFIDGLTLSAALSLNEDGIRQQELREAVAYFRKHILDVQQLSIRGMLGLDLEKIALEGYVGKLAIGGTMIELQKAGVRISAGLDFTLFGTLAIDLRDYIGIAMSFSLYLKVSANGVLGYGIWEGDLGTRNLKELGSHLQHLSPSVLQVLDNYDQASAVLAQNTLFNPGLFQSIAALPDLQVTRLGLILGIDYEGIPSFGFLGEFTLNGTSDADKGIIAFVFDSANPTKCLLDLKFPRETQKALQDLFRQCNFLGIPESTLHDVLNFVSFGGFTDEKHNWVPLRLKFALADVRIGDVFYNKGIMAQGRIGLLNGELEAAFNLRLDSSGFKGFGKMKRIDIRVGDRPVLRVLESAQSVLVKDRVLNEGLNKLLFDGPYLNLDAPLADLGSAALNSSARIEFLGLEYDTLCSLSKDGLFFKCRERLPVGELVLDVALRSLRDLQATGRCTLNFEIPELFVSAQAEGTGGIYLQGTELKAKFRLEVRFKDPVNGRSVSLPAFDVEMEAPPQLVQLLTHLAERTVETVREVAKEVFAEIKAELEQLVRVITALAEEIAAAARAIDEELHIVDTLKQNIESIKQVVSAIAGAIAQHQGELQQLEHDIQDLANQIRELTEALAQLDARRASEIVNNIPFLLQAIVLEVAGTGSAITYDVLQVVNRRLEESWNYWEQLRVDSYRERMRLDAEYRDNWLKPWAWGHPAKMGALFIQEGLCESNKFHARNLINLLAPLLEIAGAIERQTRQVQTLLGARQSEQANKMVSRDQTRAVLAERLQKMAEETAGQQSKEAEVVQREARVQAQRDAKANAERDLETRRAELEQIKNRKRAEMAL